MNTAPDQEIRRALKAGALYFAVVFSIAFCFGVFRTLILVPRIGDMPAVMVEIPLILTVSWLVSAKIIERLRVPANLVTRLLMGASAFILLMGAEAALAVLLGQTLAEHFASYTTAPVLLGLAMQMVYGLIPAMQQRRVAVG